MFDSMSCLWEEQTAGAGPWSSHLLEWYCLEVHDNTPFVIQDCTWRHCIKLQTVGHPGDGPIFENIFAPGPIPSSKVSNLTSSRGRQKRSLILFHIGTRNGCTLIWKQHMCNNAWWQTSDRPPALDRESGRGKGNSNLQSTRDRVGKVQVPRCGTPHGDGMERDGVEQRVRSWRELAAL